MFIIFRIKDEKYERVAIINVEKIEDCISRILDTYRYFDYIFLNLIYDTYGKYTFQQNYNSLKKRYKFIKTLAEHNSIINWLEQNNYVILAQS
jgi:hypothetical protein